QCGASGACQEVVAARRDRGPRFGIPQSLRHLGTLARLQGDLARAAAVGEEALAICRELGSQLYIAPALHLLGAVAHELGDDTRAAARFAESLVICQEINQQPGLAQCLDGLAAVAHARGDFERAARLLGAAAALREASGLTLPPPERAGHQRTLAAVRAPPAPPAFLPHCAPRPPPP